MSDAAISKPASTPQEWPGLKSRGYHFKLAEAPDEIDQIHGLVYRTFVMEIPQHPDPGGGRLSTSLPDRDPAGDPRRNHPLGHRADSRNPPGTHVADDRVFRLFG